MKYLIDTNVISELWKGDPEPRVVLWIDTHMDEIMVPTPVVAELADGIAATVGRNKKRLGDLFTAMLEDYPDRLASFDTAAAIEWGQAQHSPKIKRQPQSLFDSLIESIAKARGLAVVTRNTGEFRRVDTVNPWL